MPTVVLLGNLDTKGAEYEYFRDRLTESGCSVLVVDTGIREDPAFRPDIDRRQVAAAAGADLEALAAAGDRGGAVELRRMSRQKRRRPLPTSLRLKSLCRTSPRMSSRG